MSLIIDNDNGKDDDNDIVQIISFNDFTRWTLISATELA